MKPTLKNPFWQLAFLLVLLKLGLHFFTNTHYELHRDEFLYFQQGDHPSLGNASVPPLIGWVAFGVKSIFGHSVFGLRLLPALLGALTILLLAKMVLELGGKTTALLLAGSSFLLSPGFLLFDTLFTVNVFDQFFWVFLSLLFIRMIKTRNAKMWIWIGALSGLAFLNKYLVLYLLAGFAIGLLSGPQRNLFISKYFAFALLLGLLIISPNIYWQYSHDWPILFHISELGKSQMVNMSYRGFLLDLFDLNYISTFFWLTGFAVVLFSKQERRLRYLSITALATILLFLLSKGKAYYFLGFIPVLFALSGYVFEKYMGQKRMAKYAVLTLIVFFSLLSVPLSLPVFNFDKLSRYSTLTASWVSYPFSRWEDGKTHPISQVFADMTGWEELVMLVNKAYRQIPEKERKNCTIYAERNYGYAGAVHFYGKQYDLPDAITFVDSYVLWAPDTIARAPLIYIHYEIAGLDKLFGTYSEIGKVENKYFRENGVKVFLCQNPGDGLQEVYRQKAEAEKKNYRR